MIAQRDAIAAWARITYGWLGRSPDYKAALLNTLGANAEFYGKFAGNARADEPDSGRVSGARTIGVAALAARFAREPRAGAAVPAAAGAGLGRARGNGGALRALHGGLRRGGWRHPAYRDGSDISILGKV